MQNAPPGSQLEIDSGPHEPRAPQQRGASASYVFRILILGVTLGLAIGLALVRSPWGVGPAPLYDEDLVTSTFERASPAVVEIVVVPAGRNSVFPGSRRELTGSGFIADDQGHIVTNNHVIDVPGEITVRLYDGRKVSATRLGSSPADDLAVIKIDAEVVEGIAPLRLADSEAVVPGQMAIAIGSPFREVNSISVGVVSGINRSRASNELRRPIPGLVQTDAALNPGNSGGPLLNAAGEVIGVNSAVQVVSNVQIGVGYAVPSNTVANLLPDLKAGGEYKRPWLGVSGVPLTREIADALNLTSDKGIYVNQVYRNSPAASASIKGASLRSSRARGDVILAVDGEPVESITDMVSRFNGHRPGDTIWLTIERDNQSVDINVTLAPWPDT